MGKQSDFISREKLLEVLEYNKGTSGDEDLPILVTAVEINTLIEYIKNMPCIYDIESYDVEKIIEKVKKENKRSLKEMYKFYGNNLPTERLKKHNDRIESILRNEKGSI